MPELISIIIPAYNAEPWIKETIESALSQTWSNKEVIVIDDGSSDKTLQIAKGYESKSLKVIAQENGGANVARNKALEFAQGDYIQWLDADDLLAPDKIERQMLEMKKLANPRVLLTSSWARFYYRHTKARFVPDNLWQDLEPKEWLITKFSEHVWMNPATWLVSRKLAEMAGPWDERLVRDQDGEYISKVVSKSEGIKFVPESKAYYRQCNPSSLSRQLSDRSVESIFLSKSLAIGYLRGLEDSERTRQACLAHLHGILGYVSPEQTAVLQKAAALAHELGGELSFPAPGWKYSIIAQVVGLRRAKAVHRAMAMAKTSVFRKLDMWLESAL